MVAGIVARLAELPRRAVVLADAAPWTSPWLPPGHEWNFWNAAQSRAPDWSVCPFGELVAAEPAASATASTRSSPMGSLFIRAVSASRSTLGWSGTSPPDG